MPTHNDYLEPRELDLNNIYLDPNNPRFAEESAFVVPHERIVEEPVQEQAYQKMLDQFDVEALSQTIEKMGFLRMHRIVVKEIESHQGSYVVVEGNRRISACRFIYKKHLSGAFVDPAVLSSIEHIEALVYTGQDHSIAWEIQGIVHLTGVRPWSPYNQAYHLVKKMGDEALTLTQIAKTFGMTATKAGRMVRAYHALNQLKNDPDFGSRAKNSHYSYFEETFGKPELKDWLGWSDQERKFTSAPNLHTFYHWFLPENDEDKKLPMAIDVRKLPPILQRPEILQRFDSELSLEDALREVGAAEPNRSIESITRSLEQAQRSIEGIPVGTLRANSGAIADLLRNIIATAQEIVDMAGS